MKSSSTAYLACTRIHRIVGLTCLLYVLAVLTISRTELPLITPFLFEHFGKLVVTDAEYETGMISAPRASLSKNCTDTIVLASCPLQERQCSFKRKNSEDSIGIDSIRVFQQRKIPKIVWQTWKSKQFPSCELEAHHRMLRVQNPQWDFRLVDDKEADTFMGRFFPGKVSDAFHSISPKFGAARADLLRYCLLYIFGGVYLDLDSSLNCPLDDWICNDDTAIVSYERNIFPRPSHGPEIHSMYDLIASFNQSIPQPRIITPPGVKDNIVVQWMMIFAPRHAFLMSAITLVAERVLQWQDNATSGSMQSSLSPGIKTVFLTGPVVYTMAIWDVLLPSGAPKVKGWEEEDLELKYDYRFLGFDYEGYVTFKFKDSHEKEPQGSNYRALRWTEAFKTVGKPSLNALSR